MLWQNPTDGAAPVSDSSSSDDPVRGHEVHHHQIHRERLQVRAIPDRPGPGTVGSGSGVYRAAPAHHLVLVVLGDPRADLGNLVLLIAVHDPQTPGGGQVGAAVAAAGREPVLALVRVIGPGQMRSRCPRLLAP